MGTNISEIKLNWLLKCFIPSKIIDKFIYLNNIVRNLKGII